METPEEKEKFCNDMIVKILQENDCQMFVTVEKNYMTGQETPKINIIHNSKIVRK